MTSEERRKATYSPMSSKTDPHHHSIRSHTFRHEVHPYHRHGGSGRQRGYYTQSNSRDHDQHNESIYNNDNRDNHTNKHTRQHYQDNKLDPASSKRNTQHNTDPPSTNNDPLEPAEPSEPLDSNDETGSGYDSEVDGDHLADRHKSRVRRRSYESVSENSDDEREHNENRRNNRNNNRPKDHYGDNGGWDSRVTCKKKLWIGGLPPSVTSEEIKDYFSTFGNVTSVIISFKGNAFVKFSTETQAVNAFRKCKVAYIRDHLIKVKFALKRSRLPHNKLLYVNNVPFTATQPGIKKEFEKFGEVEEIQMFRSPYFATVESAVKARKALKTKYFIQFGKIRQKDDMEDSAKVEDGKHSNPQEKEFDIATCELTDVLEPLSEEQTYDFTQLLNMLQPTTMSIRACRDWVLERATSMNDILLHISVMLVAKYNAFTLRLSTLYLLHDILSYCTRKRACLAILDTVSTLALPHLQRVINKFQAPSEKEKSAVLDILSLWEQFSVFPATVVQGLRTKFLAGEPSEKEDDFL